MPTFEFPELDRNNLVEAKPVTESRPPQLKKANCTCQCGCECNPTGEEDEVRIERSSQHQRDQLTDRSSDTMISSVRGAAMRALQRRHSSPEDGAVQPVGAGGREARAFRLFLLRIQTDVNGHDSPPQSPSSTKNEPSTSGTNSLESSMVLAARSVTPDYYLRGLIENSRERLGAAVEAGKMEISLPIRSKVRSFFWGAPLILAPQPQFCLRSKESTFHERREREAYPYPWYIDDHDMA